MIVGRVADNSATGFLKVSIAPPMLASCGKFCTAQRTVRSRSCSSPSNQRCSCSAGIVSRFRSISARTSQIPAISAATNQPRATSAADAPVSRETRGMNVQPIRSVSRLVRTVVMMSRCSR